MISIPIMIKSMIDAKNLVTVAGTCDCDVDLLWGRYVVDAKSMLGVLSLPQFKNAELQIHSEECQEVQVLIKKLKELKLY